MSTTTRVISICGGIGLAAGLLAYGAYLGMVAGPSRVATIPVNQIEDLDRHSEQIRRGAYLMTIMVCQDCHTPKGPDMKPIPGMTMAGHPEDTPLPEWDPSMWEKNVMATIAPTLTAFAGPFGTSVAVNLTPDKETGIGNMTAEDLIRTFRTGKHWKEDRHVLPPMPIEFYANMEEEDIRALHAFLMTLPPVKNRVPASRSAPMPGGEGGAH
jgi:hypothetical protein